MTAENVPFVGKLLGHREHRTGPSHADLADAHFLDTAERVGNSVASAMRIEPRHQQL